MSITIELGLRIRTIRKSRNLSQEKFAELCNLHPTYIGQLERGEKSATIESLFKISRALNISLSTLFEGIDSSESFESEAAKDALQIRHQLSSLSKEKQNAACELFQALFKFLQA